MAEDPINMLSTRAERPEECPIMIKRNAHERDFTKTRFLVPAKRLAVVLPVAVSIMAGVQVHGQILHATGPLPSFEVATIKPSQPGATGIRAFGPKGADRFLAMNVTVKDLIDFAYTIDDDRQVVGLSGWMISKRYDIDAKVGDVEVAAMSKLAHLRMMDPYRFMQQSLLADRFKLKVHFETRELPIYALVVAKGGPKLKASKMDPANPAETVNPGFTEFGVGRAAVTGATMGMLAEILERQPEVGNPPGGRGRIVVDKTNLSGLYDWTLRWTPWQDLSSGELSDSKDPSLFTALQEQLGLKLEPAKGKVEVVVIDHIDLPSEN
jgi:bla regulator protein blaR1